MSELIHEELEQFVATREEVVALIEEKEAYLRKQIDDGRVSQGFVYHQRAFFDTLSRHLSATDQLHHAIGRLAIAPHEGGDPREVNHLQAKVRRLEDQNRKMEAWLRALGKDLSLLNYVRESDLRYA